MAYIDKRLADGSYNSLSDYVSKLIVQDMEHRNTATIELRSVLDDAVKSGLSERSVEEIFEYARSPRKPVGPA